MKPNKNIHILPTENSSRLSYNKDGVLELHRLQWRKNTQNIYITNDEEIKEGDWFTDDNNSLKRSYKLSHVQFANPKKIILTTDDLLIKDGVQAIDNYFLEWLINNPTCEFVEVDKNWNYPLDKSWEYKLRIIPKEEPKQETLEEAAEKYWAKQPYNQDAFEEGAKWQQEQDKNKYSDEKEFYKYMAKQDSWKSVGLIIQEFIQLKLKEQDKKLYSEEEVISLLIKREYALDLYDMANDYEDTIKWFEQFKKK